MRGPAPDLQTPHPIGPTLPSIFQEDDFAIRFTAALDKVLSPVFSTLDNVAAYLDPRLAPPDFVEWLAGWVGLALDENWPVEQRRALIANAVDLYSWRGTIRGVSRMIEIYTGSAPEITDSGGVASSEAPGGAIPGADEPKMKVTLRSPDPSGVDVKRIELIVASSKPAHILHEIEVAAR